MTHPTANITLNNYADKLTRLHIQQQNTNKSLVTQSNILHQLDPRKYDLGMIQEPYLDHFHNSHANHHWYAIYPKEHYTNPADMRSLILVNKWLATDSWLQVDFSSSDMTAIQLKTARGKLLVVNMYNEVVEQQGIKQAVMALRHRSCE